MNKLAAVARGEVPADLVVKNASIANVYTGKYEKADVAVCNGTIAGIGQYDGINIIEAQGRVLIPALIDGHIHIEDTMMTPANFAHEAALHGTGTVFADPHEIANVLGIMGVEYMSNASKHLPVDIYYGAPSCVPASEFETPRETLGVDAIKTMFAQGLTQHLGEMMNFPAVIAGDDEVWEKIQAAGNTALTGHAPGLRGNTLCAYLSSGIDSDHECTALDEAREKLSRGMWLMLREGASFHDLINLLPLIRENVFAQSRCMAVSDDITARYLVEHGHMDDKMRIMLHEGIDPFVALRLVTINPAEYFMRRNIGAIAPGKKADFALLTSETIDQTFTVNEVWHDGIRIDDIRPNASGVITSAAKAVLPTLEEIARFTPDTGETINVIGIREGSPITDTLTLPYDGSMTKIIVVERHNATGRFASGYVKGLGITHGAIGSSVAHDAHNFVVAGNDDVSILTALQALRGNNGGLICTEGTEVKGSLPLPIAGLMADMNARDTADALQNVENVAAQLGVKIAHPFMVLSFLCLSVIPSLKITDKGYVDITKGGIQSLSVSG